MPEYQHAGTQKNVYREDELEFVSCPACDSNQYDCIATERGALGIVQCKACTLIYTNPRLKEPGKVYWGETKNYEREARLIFLGKANHHRDPNYLDDLRFIARYKSAGRFLDIGTNMGFFLRLARGGEWTLQGVEPSPALGAIARDNFDLNVVTATLEDAAFPSHQFDVITLADVFEHITKPRHFLSEIQRIIKPEGVLFVKVPNARFSLFKFRVARRIGRITSNDLFDAYEHVVHYTEVTLKAMLERCGFRVVQTRIGRPVQAPVWHEYVGEYFQYPSPWFLDWKRHTARQLLFRMSLVQKRLFGRISSFAPNISVIARPQSG